MNRNDDNTSVKLSVNRAFHRLPIFIFLWIPVSILSGKEPMLPVIPGPPGNGLRRIYHSLSERATERTDSSKLNTSRTLGHDEEKDPNGRVREDQERYESLSIEAPPINPGNKKVTGDNRISLLSPEDLVEKKILPDSPIPEREKTESPSKKSTINTMTAALQTPQNPSAPELLSRENVDPVSFPSDLTPTPRTTPRKAAPDFYRGIYINNYTARTFDRFAPLLKKASREGINTLVVDAQPVLPGEDFLNLAGEYKFYLVARVVVFPGGLKEYPPDLKRIAGVLAVAENSAREGFDEIQLDYIRFADRTGPMRVSLDRRYKIIGGILKMATNRLRPMGVRVGADIFGRIAFNRDDIIGQKLEVFSPHLDTIYPMLYPSHFYGEPARIRDPYRTIRDGARSCKERAGKNSRIVSYIQGFKMSIGPSGLSYAGYIKRQLEATDEAGDGYIVWNAANHYGAFFRALKIHREEKASSGKDKGQKN